jgi:hypothetical protein
VALTYTQYLALHRLAPTAQNAANWLRTEAPAGTAIPTALRSQFAGATHTGTPAAAPAPAPSPAPAPAAPPAPIYTPPDPSSDPTLQSIAAQLAGLPGVYNPQRMSDAATTAASLADYSDTPIGITPVGVAGGDQAYQLQLGADGRLYRRGAADDIYGAASHGDVGSSGLQNSLADTHRDLDLQAQQILTNWMGGQQTSLANELAQRGQLGTDWGGALSAWQQNQTGIASQAGSPQTFASTLAGFAQPAAATTPAAAQPAAAAATPKPATPAQAATSVATGVKKAAKGITSGPLFKSIGSSWGKA